MAATIAVAAAGVVVVALVALWRCGGFFGESSAPPGSFAVSLCRDEVGRAIYLTIFAAAGLGGGTAIFRALAASDERRLRAPLIAAALVPATAALLYAVSGALPGV